MNRFLSCFFKLLTNVSVNLAARLEKVAAKLGETIVASADFAKHFPSELVRRGEFPVAGFAAPQTVYGFPQ